MDNFKQFMDAFKHSDAVKVILTGIGESEFSAEEIHKQIEAQQQEIEQLKHNIFNYIEWNEAHVKSRVEQDKLIDKLVKDKDEQAGRIMRMEELLRVAKTRLSGSYLFCDCGTCKVCGKQIGYGDYIYCDDCLTESIDALLGGNEDV